MFVADAILLIYHRWVCFLKATQTAVGRTWKRCISKNARTTNTTLHAAHIVMLLETWKHIQH